MGIIKKVRYKIGRYFLTREKARLKRKVKAFSIEKASSIAIVYDATNRNDYETVKKFVQWLKEERKEVLSLGFINSKESSEIVRPHLNYIYFDQNNLSKWMIPQGNDVKKFINTSFSILIDLNVKPCFPIEYIGALSHAKFKVGAKGVYHDTFCDLTIAIDANKNVSFLIQQVKHYLNMIRN